MSLISDYSQYCIEEMHRGDLPGDGDDRYRAVNDFTVTTVDYLPGDDTFVMRELGRLSFIGSLNPVSWLDGSRVIIQSSSTLVIWDFMKDRITGWRHSVENPDAVRSASFHSHVTHQHSPSSRSYQTRTLLSQSAPQAFLCLKPRNTVQYKTTIVWTNWCTAQFISDHCTVSSTNAFPKTPMSSSLRLTHGLLCTPNPSSTMMWSSLNARSRRLYILASSADDQSSIATASTFGAPRHPAHLPGWKGASYTQQ